MVEQNAIQKIALFLSENGLFQPKSSNFEENTLKSNFSVIFEFGRFYPKMANFV